MLNGAIYCLIIFTLVGGEIGAAVALSCILVAFIANAIDSKEW